MRLTLVALLLSLTVVGAAQASTLITAPAPPWQLSNLFLCIGGDRCGGTNNVVIAQIPAGSFIRQVDVFAHDRVGERTNAHLEVYVDGVLVGRQDVLKDGSWLFYPVNRFGSQITLRSVHKSNDSGGEETVVVHLRVT